MYVTTVDYLADRATGNPRTLLHRGIKIHEIPRLIPLCRLRGHRSIVDGNPGYHPGDLGSRWVCCDRCGVRPEPQGRLDPAMYSIGDAYTGPFADALPAGREGRETLKSLKASFHPPGPWPASPHGEIGTELVLGPSFGGASIGIEIGCAGSTTTVSWHLTLHHLGSLHLYTERHGQWLQRRLNRTGYDNRVIEIGVADGRLRWSLWTKAGEWSSDTPRWRDGFLVVSAADRLLGPVTHRYTDIGAPVTATVRMPEGDDHNVTLQLQRQTTGRKRGRQTEQWSVDWDSDKGIPFRRDSWKGDCIHSSHVPVSEASVQLGTWPLAATAAIAAQMTRHRIDNDYSPALATG